MPTRIPATALLCCVTAVATAGSGASGFDYFQANREMIRNGVQALLTCNGLFTSGRTLAQVFEQELDYLEEPVGSAGGGDYVIDRELRAVAVGGGAHGPVIRAVFREGIGCVVMAPDQDFDDMDALPERDPPPPPVDAAQIPWPMGDRVPDKPLPADIDAAALEQAAQWTFERPAGQRTVSLLVVHRGDIVLERYGPGFDRDTRTRTWSTAKSIAATLIGMLVDDGRLALDAPLDLPWRPAVDSQAPDPRDAITLRHLLHMSSGLYPVDSFDMEYATGSGLAYWAGASSVEGALDRGLIREPGTFWDYENYDTLLAVLAMKRALGARAYPDFPRKALLNPLGMRNTLISTDRFGDFILSSQVYTNARDLARFGLLYLQNGRWQGKQLVSEQWIEFVRTPAPATRDDGGFYGAQWWLAPADRADVPAGAYSTAGNRGQFVIVVPSHELVIVRRGLDKGGRRFDFWELAARVAKAVK